MRQKYAIFVLINILYIKYIYLYLYKTYTRAIIEIKQLNNTNTICNKNIKHIYLKNNINKIVHFRKLIHLEK